MMESNRTMEADYYDPSYPDEQYDVSFELTEDAEDKLFTALADDIAVKITDGTFPAHRLHLMQRLAGQRRSHPPWVDTDDVRVYDLELSESDYSILTRVVGQSMDNVLRSGGAGPYQDLVEAWDTITEQMKDGGRFTDEMADNFLCHVGANKNFRKFKNGDHRWYVCTECDTELESRVGHECGE